MSAANELGFKTYNTRRNLPPHTGRRRGEANFVGAFLKAFMNRAKDGYWCGRHFAVEGCGVADCVIFRLDKTRSGRTKTHLIAFEAKLRDWRKALAQAFRYRYYADSAVVILPSDAARAAVDNRRMFERCGVGLWTFNSESGAICPRIAPKKRVPLNARKREQALLLIEGRSRQFRKIRKKSKSFKHGR